MTIRKKRNRFQNDNSKETRGENAQITFSRNLIQHFAKSIQPVDGDGRVRSIRAL